MLATGDSTAAVARIVIGTEVSPYWILDIRMQAPPALIRIVNGRGVLTRVDATVVFYSVGMTSSG